MGRRGRPGERSVQARRAKPSTATENGEQSAPTGRRINRRSVRRAFIARSCISCISCISCWSSQSYLGKLPAKTPVCFLLHDAVGPIGHIGPLGRRLTPLYTTPYRRPAGAFCSPFSVAVEGLALWACTVIAAQRSASSPPKAAARASTSVAPPSLQASKLPSFSGVSFVLFVFSPKHSTSSHRPHPSRACRALCSLFSVHCSLFSRAAMPPLRSPLF